MNSAAKMQKALNLFQQYTGKRDVPVTWITLLLVIAEAGEAGAGSDELLKRVGVAQGIISRTVRLLSTYYDKSLGSMAGCELVTVTPDPRNRRQFTNILTPRGRELMAALEKVLGN